MLVAINQPFTLWMLHSFFLSIPKDLDESAMVDGCSRFEAFRSVVIPVMWPGVVTTGLFRFLLAYNDFAVTAMLLSRRQPDDGAENLELPRLGAAGGQCHVRGRRRGLGHGAALHPRPVLPTPDRQRPHRRRSEGITAMAEIRLKNVSKRWHNFVGVDNFNLDIADQEFLVLLGPSGCGKTTTMRMIAGLEDVTDGEIWLGDRMVNKLEPKDRDISMVFQSYGLYPNMTVYENIRFPLRVRKVPKELHHEKVMQAAKMVELTDFLRAPAGGPVGRPAPARGARPAPSCASPTPS